VVTISVGNTLTLPAETGTNAGNYTTTRACTANGGGTANSVSDTNGQNSATLLIGVNDANKAIICTYTNTPKAPTLSLQKALGGTGRIAPADQFSLSGTSSTSAPVPTSATTTGAGTNITSGAYTVSASAGTTYTLDEAMANGSTSTLAQYSQAVSCSNTGPTVVTGFTRLPISVIPANGDAINCTVTNTPAPAVIGFAKSSGSSSIAAGAVVPYALTLTNTGGTAQPSGFVFYEVVPDNTTFSSVANATSSCAVGSAERTLCTLTTTAPVPAAGSLVVTYTVTVNASVPASATSLVNAIYKTAPSGCTGSTCPAPVCPDATAAACDSTPTAALPDLKPTITFGGTSYTVGVSRDVILNINDILNAPTSGLVRFFVPLASSNFTFDFDATRTTGLINGVSQVVNNRDWDMTRTSAGMLFSNSLSNILIPGNGRSRIVITTTATQAGGTANVTINIAPGSGGESESRNNTVSVSLSIQR